MQFSIRRPKLPSSETHPEESMYKRLGVSAWLNHLNELGQVEEEYKLRKVRSEPSPLPRGEPAGNRERARGKEARVWPPARTHGPPPWESPVFLCEALCEHSDKAIKAAALKKKKTKKTSLEGLGGYRVSLHRRVCSEMQRFQNQGLGHDVRTTR